MIILSLFLIIGFAVLIIACLKISSRPAYILGIYIIAFTNIVITALIANFFNQINNQGFFLGGHLFFMVGGIFGWLLSGMPSLLGPWKNNRNLIPPGWYGESWRKWSVVWILFILVVVVYTIGAWLIPNVPQNTHDALSTHLARVGFWLQHGNLQDWPTPNNLSLIYPVNANLVMLWIILFTKSNTLAGFIQWLSALASAASIFGISRLLGWNRPQALFAALLWLTLPQVLFQSTSIFLDLFVASIFMIAIYFFILGIQKRSFQVLILSGLSLGLSIGTKQLTLFTIPGLAILLLLVWIKDRKRTSKLIVIWGLSGIIFTFIFGSYIYAQNYLVFGNMLGDEYSLSHRIGGKERGGSLPENLTYNSVRHFYESIDFTGLPPIFTDNLTRLKKQIFQPVLLDLGLDLESTKAMNNTQNLFLFLDYPLIREDFAWFGILGFFLILPISIYQFYFGIRLRDPFRVGLVIIAFTYFVLLTIFRPGWDRGQGRYFILAVGLVFPFISMVVQQKQIYKILDWIIVSFAVIISINITLSNASKPLISSSRLEEIAEPFLEKSDRQTANKISAILRYSFPNTEDIWGLNHIQRTMILNDPRTMPIKFIEDFVPKTAKLALGVRSNLDIFPLFGDQMARSLFFVYPPEKLNDKQWFMDNGINFFLLDMTDEAYKNLPSWLLPYKSKGRWGLYYPKWASPIK